MPISRSTVPYECAQRARQTEALLAAVVGRLRSPLAHAIDQALPADGGARHGASALVWLSVLSRWDVSKAYPLVGFGFALTAVVGYFIGEELNASRWAGVALICLGVALVGRS